MKYAYPAIFTKEENGSYSVEFNDFTACFTCGDDMVDALENAKDVLALTLYGYETEGKEIPVPGSNMKSELGENETVNYVSCDTLSYRKRFENRAVKKTLTIPSWLNEEAIALNINFSQVLQDALLEKVER